MEQSNSKDSSDSKKLWLSVTGACGKILGATLKTREQVMDIYERGGVLEMCEVFEYLAPTGLERSQAGVMISKQHFATRFDATTKPMQMYISLQGSLVYFLENLNIVDVDFYKEVMTQAAGVAEKVAESRSKLIRPGAPILRG